MYITVNFRHHINHQSFGRTEVGYLFLFKVCNAQLLQPDKIANSSNKRDIVKGFP